MNFKTAIRLAKQAINKKEFIWHGHRVVNADGYVACWVPDQGEVGAWDLEGGPVTLGDRERAYAETLVDYLSPPLEEMVKVNSNYLRRAISAIETKGNEPLYLDIMAKRILLAYEVDGEIHRAAIACMENG